jgi:hypothetical protein
MVFNFEIADAHVASIQAYLATQIKVSTDEVTKAQRMEPMFPGGIQEFITHQLTNLVEQVVTQYPDPETRAQMAEQQRIKNETRARLAPKVLSNEEVAARVASRGPAVQ